MIVRRYTAADQAAWDDFVRNSKNGWFLFERGYMDYHADRFSDHSLLVYDDRDRLIALLPAHQRDDALISHNGLTYGGFITGERMKTPVTNLRIDFPDDESMTISHEAICQALWQSPETVETLLCWAWS